MAKDPAFLFYPGDFTTGTQFFTDEQVGKYIRLLMAQHQLGHLDEKHMLMICKSYDKDIFSKFVKDKDGLWYNERLDNEIVKRKNYSKSRAENRLSKKNISVTYDNHMENRNKNEDVINNRLEYYKDKIECFNEWQSNERLIEEILMLIQKFGFTSANRIHVINIFRNFLLVEFSITKTKSDHEHHLRRWVNKMGKKIHEYAS
jgi:uncharacterized protein YdaU (DUF1376 family)